MIRYAAYATPTAARKSRLLRTVPMLSRSASTWEAGTDADADTLTETLAVLGDFAGFEGFEGFAESVEPAAPVGWRTPAGPDGGVAPEAHTDREAFSDPRAPVPDETGAFFLPLLSADWDMRLLSRCTWHVAARSKHKHSACDAHAGTRLPHSSIICHGGHVTGDTAFEDSNTRKTPAVGKDSRCGERLPP